MKILMVVFVGLVMSAINVEVELFFISVLGLNIPIPALIAVAVVLAFDFTVLISLKKSFGECHDRSP